MKASAPETPQVETKEEIVEEKKEEVVDDRPVTWVEKIGGGEEQQAVINYAYARCGEECVLTWEGESGWRKDIVSKANSNGTRDHGYCQLNSQYHKPFINSEEFKDPYKQIDYCISVWNDAVKKGRLKTTFYAYNIINKRPGVRDRIIFHKD